MSLEFSEGDLPEIEPCVYPGSRLCCRGPQVSPVPPYLVCLGGNEVFGKFVSDPFPRLLADGLDRHCLNLGALNAGIDSFVEDQGVMRIARGAQAAIVQVMGAQNLSNRYYRVHPRRNDRFVAPTADLRRLFPEVDFTRFHFNRHLLYALRAVSPDRFDKVVAELQNRWITRMQLLLSMLPGEVVLLWLRYQLQEDPLSAEPLFVSREMVSAVASAFKGVVELELRTEDGSDWPRSRLRDLLGPATHRRISEALQGALPPSGENRKGPPDGGPS
jgi:hypothetical protein